MLHGKKHSFLCGAVFLHNKKTRKYCKTSSPFWTGKTSGTSRYLCSQEGLIRRGLIYRVLQSVNTILVKYTKMTVVTELDFRLHSFPFHSSVRWDRSQMVRLCESSWRTLCNIWSYLLFKYCKFFPRTYDECEFVCHPNLNVIIGPNGTGKSSLVCAICLGLGGATKVIGRAKDAQDFIKYGCDAATIEIELWESSLFPLSAKNIFPGIIWKNQTKITWLSV